MASVLLQNYQHYSLNLTFRESNKGNLLLLQFITYCIYAVVKNIPIENQVYVAGDNVSQIYEMKIYNTSMARLLEPERSLFFFSKGIIANASDFSRTLHHAAIHFGPLKNVLLTHNVRIDEQVAIANAEVFLTGSAFEAFEVIDFVTDTHGHFKGPDSLFTGSAEPVLTKQSEVVSPAQLPAKFVVKPAAHLA